MDSYIVVAMLIILFNERVRYDVISIQRTYVKEAQNGSLKLSRDIQWGNQRTLPLTIIIIIMSCRQHGYLWPSLATFPYRSSLPAGLLGYIQCPHVHSPRKPIIYYLTTIWHFKFFKCLFTVYLPSENYGHQSSCDYLWNPRPKFLKVLNV